MKVVVRRSGILLLSAALLCATLSAQTTPPSPVQPDTQTTLAAKSWDLLRTGVKEKTSTRRAAAVRALSLLQGEKRAIALATAALTDSKPEVRTAAATALGELSASSSIPNLKEAMSDKELSVVLAAAHSLLTLKDTTPYELYYAVLSGDRKGNGLISGQLAVLKDPKKMAILGLRQGISYVPFGDIGYTAVTTMTKDSGAPIRASAAKVLADDPDPTTQNMLAQEAVSDKSELVRIAALEAVAKHNDPAAVDKISAALADTKSSVRYAAAAAVLHLQDVSRRKTKPRK